MVKDSLLSHNERVSSCGEPIFSGRMCGVPIMIMIQLLGQPFSRALLERLYSQKRPRQRDQRTSFEGIFVR